MTRITKITESLHWSSLKENFPIGQRTTEELKRDANGKIVLVKGEPVVVKTTKFINELETAIADGTLDKMIAEAATKYHAGNIQNVLAALAKDLDSQRCNLKKRAYAPNKPIDEIRLETLSNFVKSRREAKTRTTDGLPQWAYGTTEIDAIDDVAKLQKVINSINDVCCGKAGGTYVKHLGEDYLTVAKANREYAQKRKAQLLTMKTDIDPAILAKLGKGSKVSLTAEEAAILSKLLSK